MSSPAGAEIKLPDESRSTSFEGSSCGRRSFVGSLKPELTVGSLKPELTVGSLKPELTPIFVGVVLPPGSYVVTDDGDVSSARDSALIDGSRVMAISSPTC